MSDRLRFQPGLGPTGGGPPEIGRLLLAHDAYLQVRAVRRKAERLAVILAIPLALSVMRLRGWSDRLARVTLVGFAAALAVLVAAAIGERVWLRRRAMLAGVEPGGPPVSAR